MAQGWKYTLIAMGVAGIVSTPLVWLLGSPNSGQLVGASLQVAVGIGALLWAWFSGRDEWSEDVAERTGGAEAFRGGTAVSGVRRRGRRWRWSAKARRTGQAKATGDGSTAVSGVDQG